MHDGTRVAVKVQYPGVREAIGHDLANVGMLISMAGVVSRGLDAGPIISDLKEGILGELDYLHEAASQQRFYDEFEGHAFIRVPRVYHELTTAACSCRSTSTASRSRRRRRWASADRHRVAEIVFRYAFGSIYRHHLFNGDPHPGNYLLLDDGSVAFVDYGCVSEFSAETIAGFVRILRAVMDDQHEEWRAAVEAAGILQTGAPFTTEELWDHMRWYWAPVLDDEVTFTPELAAEMVRRNTQTTGIGGRINKHCNVPEGTVFLTRINFGLAGLLGNLHARGPWRGIVREYIDGAPPARNWGGYQRRRREALLYDDADCAASRHQRRRPQHGEHVGPPIAFRGARVR